MSIWISCAASLFTAFVRLLCVFVDAKHTAGPGDSDTAYLITFTPHLTQQMADAYDRLKS